MTNELFQCASRLAVQKYRKTFVLISGTIFEAEFVLSCPQKFNYEMRSHPNMTFSLICEII